MMKVISIESKLFEKKLESINSSSQLAHYVGLTTKELISEAQALTQSISYAGGDYTDYTKAEQCFIITKEIESRLLEAHDNFAMPLTQICREMKENLYKLSRL